MTRSQTLLAALFAVVAVAVAAGTATTPSGTAASGAAPNLRVRMGCSEKGDSK